MHLIIWALWDTLERQYLDFYKTKESAITSMLYNYDDDERQYIRLVEVELND